jgi:hypothetical protein
LSQAKTKAREADDTVKQRLPETYQWLIVPTQSNPQVPIEFSEVRLQGADRLAPRASKKLVNDGGLATKFAGTLLRMELDKIPLWRGESVTLKQLAEDFAQYVYLPRLKSPSVLIEAVRDGVSSLTWETEGFAYADSYDDKKKRYAGLKTAQIDAVVSDGRSVVVRSDTARKQLDAEAMPPPVVDGGGIPPPGGTVRGGATTGGSITGGTTTTGGGGVASPARRDPTRFYGTIDVDPERVARDAGRVAQEVLAHLVGIVDSDVEVSIEITASVKDGIDPAIVRAVAENCKTLKFRSFGFEA